MPAENPMENKPAQPVAPAVAQPAVSFDDIVAAMQLLSIQIAMTFDGRAVRVTLTNDRGQVAHFISTVPEAQWVADHTYHFRPVDAERLRACGPPEFWTGVLDGLLAGPPGQRIARPHQGFETDIRKWDPKIIKRGGWA